MRGLLVLLPSFDDVSGVSDCRGEKSSDESAGKMGQRVVGTIGVHTTDKLKVDAN